MVKMNIGIQLSSKIYEIKTSESCKINLGHLENVSYMIPIRTSGKINFWKHAEPIDRKDQPHAAKRIQLDVQHSPVTT